MLIIPQTIALDNAGLQYVRPLFLLGERIGILKMILNKCLRAEYFSKKERKIMGTRNKSNLVFRGFASVSAFLLAFTSFGSILVELPKTMPRPQYKSQTSGLMCYPVEEALQAWSLSVDDDKLLLAMAAVASMADYGD